MCMYDVAHVLHWDRRFCKIMFVVKKWNDEGENLQGTIVTQFETIWISDDQQETLKEKVKEFCSHFG